MNSFDLLRCGEYTWDWENRSGGKLSFRLLAVSGGKLRVAAKGQKWTLKSNDMILLQPGTTCVARKEEESKDAFHIYEAAFDVHDTQLLQQLRGLNQAVTVENFHLIKSCFQGILEECQAKRTFYTQMSACYFWMILMELIRPHFAPVVAEEELEIKNPGQQQEKDMQKVERYCREHYTSQISLEELAALINYNKTTLLANFREVYGTTPRNYIIQLRLKKARELLLDTDRSISEISEQVGFSSVHYFSRFFKAKEQYSPVEYRLRYARNRSYVLEGQPEYFRAPAAVPSAGAY